VSAAALDTSAAVPYVLASHVAHAAVRSHLARRSPVLTGHSVAETYSVLTRLPGDARLAPADAARLIAANFDAPAVLSAERAATLPAYLAPLGIAGGAVYDALIALAAIEARLPVITRDRRAASTYAALSATVEVVASD
jgi:predicted nucleic acid-binding protein